MSIRARQMVCPWFLWRLAAAATVDVLAVLVVNHAAQPGKLTQPSEAILSQVLASLVAHGIILLFKQMVPLTKLPHALAAAQRALWRHRVEVHAGLFVQVLVTLLNALVVGFAMEPFSHRVRSELLVVRSDGGPAAASQPLRCPAGPVQSNLGTLWASLASVAFCATED